MPDSLMLSGMSFLKCSPTYLCPVVSKDEGAKLIEVI